MKDIEIIGSYWTLAGDVYPHSEYEFSPSKFEDRVAAAYQAGFKGFALKEVDLEHILHRLTIKDVRHILEDNGMKHVELEFLTDWFVTGEEKKKSDKMKHFLLESAEALEARHVKVGDFEMKTTPMPRLIESFAALCKDAENYGTKILFELIVDGMIRTLPETLEMVQGADAPNGGIMIDLWHVVKLGIPYEDVARIPSRFLLGIEINDGTLESSYSLHEDTVNHRELPGEGEFDVKGFVKCMLDAGYDGPWGVEVLSHELRKEPLKEAIPHAFRTTMAQCPGNY